MNAIATGIADGFLVGEPAWAKNTGERNLFLASALSSQGVIERVARHYELAEPLTCSLFRRANNDAYVLASGTQRFLLKIYRYNTRSREALLEELSAINLLRSRGILVGAPVPRRDGDLITEILFPEGLRRAVLFDWISGDEPAHDEASQRKIGRALATLHVAARDIKTAARPRLDFARLFERPIACIEEKVADSPALTERLHQLVRTLAPQVENAQATLQDWGFCHGDCDHSNMYISEQQVGFFDFDWCGMGWLPYDVATFRRSGLLAGVEGSMLQPVMAGYLEVRPEAADAVRTVPLFTVLRHLWLVEHVIVDACCAGGFEQTKPRLKLYIDVAERLARDL